MRRKEAAPGMFRQRISALVRRADSSRSNASYTDCKIAILVLTPMADVGVRPTTVGIIPLMFFFQIFYH
jgi:hypothetical protein